MVWTRFDHDTTICTMLAQKIDKIIMKGAALYLTNKTSKKFYGVYLEILFT